MKKEDIKSLVLSLIINGLFILLLPMMEVPIEDNGKISVGLIQLKEENKKISSSGDAEKKIAEPKVEKKANIEKVDPKKEQKVQEQKETPKKEKKILPVVLPVVEDLDILGIESKTVRNKSIFDKKMTKKETYKKDINKNIKKVEKNDQNDIIEEVELDKSVFDTKNIQFEGVENTEIIKNGEILANTSEETGGQNTKLDLPALASSSTKLEGLPKGYEDIGSIDGNLTGRWEKSNRLPNYPEVAELKGRTGKVILLIEVSENGRVQRVRFKSKSGVPELDSSIEKVANTWIIHLSRGGKRVYGSITIDIPFRLLSKGV